MTKREVPVPTVADVGRVLAYIVEKYDVTGEYRIQGGGLRHGDISWEIVYEADGLTRYLFLTAHNDERAHEVVVDAQVAATDGQGRWSHIARPSPRCGSMDELTEFVVNILSDGIAKANGIRLGAVQT